MTNWPLVALAVLVAYLVWCIAYPMAACPWCGGKKTRGDGRGNYRFRSCWICHGKPWRRIGARMLGTGRRKP